MKVIISQEQIDKLKSLIDRHGIDSLGIEPYKLIEMGLIKHYDGDLYLDAPIVKSLGKLKFVEGFLNLANSKIESLGSLEEVGGYLYLRGTPISRTMSKYDIREKIKVGGIAMLAS
jgi:hypothetical protein